MVTRTSQAATHQLSTGPRLLNPAESILLHVARSEADRAAAYQLIHDAYAAAGYVDHFGFSVPEPYGSPDARTFLMTQNGKPCATFTIIPDGPLGLVMEPIYSQELSDFRRPDRLLGEVSGLVVDKVLSGDERATALLYLYETAYLFSRASGVTDLLIAVNPHHASFYERSLLFDSFGSLKTYEALRGAPSVAKRLHMPSWPSRLHARYGRPEENRSQRFPMDSLLRILVQGLQDGHVPPGLDLEQLPSLSQETRIMRSWDYSHSDALHPPSLSELGPASAVA